jgi:malate synthase
MANIQDLMRAVLDPRLADRTPGLYSAWVTPNGGAPRHESIRSTLPISAIRLEVAAVARTKFPQGFTFSVRPQ